MFLALPPLSPGLLVELWKRAVLVVLGLVFVGAAADARDDETLRYELHLQEAEAPRLEIRVRIPSSYAVVEDPSSAPRCVLRLPTHWGGATELHRRLIEPWARTESGRELTLTTLDGPRWQVEGLEPGEAFRLGYELRPSEEAPGNDGSTYYQVQLFPDHLHLIGHTALVVPEGLDHDEERSLSVALRGFEEAGWSVATSFGEEADGRALRMSLSRFSASLVVAGDFRILRREVLGGQLVCALRGETWNFEDEAFAELAADVIEIERLFFGDDEQPHYLISALPVGTSPRSSMGGTGLTNSFGLFLSPGYQLDDADQRRQILTLLAHELFHHWNGHTIRLAQPEAAGYWFSEGFTDYFCRRLLLEHGLMSADEYREELNRLFSAYFCNPRRLAPNEEIQRGFFRVRELGELPYQRGHLVAHWLDHQIRLHSEGDADLSGFMQELCWDCADTGERVDTESLFTRLSEWLPEAILPRLRAVIVDGETPPLDPETFARFGSWSEHDYAPFELGFDYQSSMAENRIQGVRPDSAAAAAGLRDGQQVQGVSIHFDRPDLPVRLHVQDEDGARVVEYLPQAPERVRGPRLLPSSGER